MAPGLITGGLLGLAAGMAFTEEQSCKPESFFCFDYGSEKLMGGLLGGGIGSLVGGLVSGVILPGERWKDAAVPPLALGEGPRGASLALALPFPPRRRP